MTPMPVKLAAARFKLADRRPYFAHALWSMQFIARPGMGTIGIDQWWRVYYDPAKVETWTHDELVGLLYHELGHVLRDHASRAKALGVGRLNHGAWNACADAEQNPRIIGEQFTLPEGGVYPATLNQPNGRLAEEYYANLPENPAPHGCDCGSGADGVPRSHEEPKDSPDASAVGKAEADLMRRQAAEKVRSAGDAPSEWKRWAETVLTSVVDWRRELSATVRRAVSAASGMVDYTYSKPARRQGEMRSGSVIMPAMRRPLPTACIVIDTSGSMGDGDLARAIAEVDGVLRSLGSVGVSVMSCDSAATVARRVLIRSQVTLSGGGGTDMGAGIAAARKGKPDVIIVITDGFTPWPATSEGGGRVVAVLTQDCVAPPSWIKSIRVQS